MSRVLIACSLVAALTTSAMARSVAAPTRFARPAASDVYEPDLRIAPQRVLDRAAVRAKLIASRAANLARFRAYQQKGSFPSNVYTGSALNVWRDPAGNLCAAATIIRASGATELVEQTAEDDNFIRLATVTSGPMMDWILTSGLTQAELALIQRPFRPVVDRPSTESPTTAAINPSLRAKETARLAKLYREIEATLIRNQKRSLDAAVDRLMKRPMLASQLVHGHS